MMSRLQDDAAFTPAWIYGDTFTELDSNMPLAHIFQEAIPSAVPHGCNPQDEMAGDLFFNSADLNSSGQVEPFGSYLSAFLHKHPGECLLVSSVNALKVNLVCMIHSSR